jgi:hypothetical protein
MGPLEELENDLDVPSAGPWKASAGQNWLKFRRNAPGAGFVCLLLDSCASPVAAGKDASILAIAYYTLVSLGCAKQHRLEVELFE